MATSLTGVVDRINSQWFRISQRLQWAAGSNPKLNATIDEFERAMNRRKVVLQVNTHTLECPVVYTDGLSVSTYLEIAFMVVFGRGRRPPY